MSAIERVATALRKGVSDLVLLPNSLIEATMEELRLPNAEKADVFVELARAKAAGEGDATSILARHFAEQERRSQEPWRIQAANLDARRTRYKAEPRDALQRAFADLARNQMLSVTESIIGSYVLFGNEDDLRFFGALLCREAPDERIRSHNFFVGEQLGPDFLAQYGRQLLDLEYPLFPADDRFSTLNQRLLREQREVVGAGPAKTPSVFRRNAEAELGHKKGDDVVGAGTLPLQQNPQGEFFIDTTPIERGFDEVFSNLRQLSAKVEALAADKGSERHSAGLTSVLTGLRQAVSQLQRTTLPGRTRSAPKYQPPNRRGPRGGENPAPRDF